MKIGMSPTKIKIQIENEIGTLLLSPPEGKPPTLDSTVMAELEQAIEKLCEEGPRIVFVRSMSDRYFCVGANLNVLQNTNEQTIVPWVKQGHQVINRLEDLPMPVIAVVQGYAMGGGLELAMACDLIFVSEDAQLAQSEAGLGFIPGWGGTRRLAGRIGAAKANNRNALNQFKTILNEQERKARDKNAVVEATRSVSCLQDPDTKQRLSDFLSKRGKK